MLFSKQSKKIGACILSAALLVYALSVFATAPSYPRSLAGTIVSSTSVGLTWQAPANPFPAITDYLVEYKLSSDWSWTTFSDGASTTTSATVTGLTNGLAYDFRVSAINSDGTGMPSPSISIVGWISATGGTVTEVGGYRIHTFTSSASIVFNGTGSIDALIVGGGWGGGASVWGAGGAGGVIATTSSVSSSTLSVTVGAGGAASAGVGANGWAGGSSVFNGNTAIGWGFGGGLSAAGWNGGSGGGGGADTRTGGTGTVGQGNNGGNGVSQNAGGGGGGAGGVGGNGGGGVGGAGGIGIQSSITGVATYYGGGGGGGGRTNVGGTAAGTGGLGGGGAGGRDVVGTAGMANTGGGGGGGWYNANTGTHLNGGGGGSWVVIIRYLIPFSGVQQVPVISSATSNAQQVALVWSIGTGSSPALIDYKIEYKLSSDWSWTTFSDGVSTATSTTVTGLTNGLAYDFRVSSINSSSTVSDPSDVVSSTPNNRVPDAPQSLAISVGTSTQAALTWNAPVSDNGAATTDYLVEYKLSSDWSWTTFTDGVSATTNTTITGLTDGSPYDFRVSAINSVGTSAPSASVTDTPGRYSLSESFNSPTINTSKWTEFDSVVGGSGGSVGNVQIINWRLSITGNSAWWVNALQSTQTFARTYGDITIQVTMTSPSCTTGDSFNFGYGDGAAIGSPGMANYIITKSGSTWTLYYFNNGSVSSSAPITGVSCTANTDLTMRLVVSQVGGAKLYLGTSTTPAATLSGGTINNKKVWFQTNGSAFTTTFDNIRVIEPLPLPLAPGSITTSPTSTQVGLSWTAGDSNGSTLTDYLIEYKLPTTATWTTFNDGVSTSTSATVTGLTNGILYNFRITPISNNGTGAPSVSVDSIPRITTLTAPTAASISIMGTPALGEKLRWYYVFADPNGDIEGVSTYRWLSSDTVGGTYSPISGATSSTYVVTSNEVGKYLKFELTPVSRITPTTGTPILTSASSQVTSTSYLNHILSTGQSLSTGYAGTPALTTTQPYSNKMLSGTSLVPLVEAGLESMSSALGNTLTSLSPNTSFQNAVTMHGVPSYGYSLIKKWTAAYTNGMTQATNVYNAATGLGKVGRVIGVTTIHGESDKVEGNEGVYESYLHEWQTNYDTDVRAITWQSGMIPLFTDQTSSHTGYWYATSLIPIAQLAASEDYPGQNILIGPKYFLTYVDGGHLNNVSYRWLGEYYGKVIKKVVIDKETWRPLSPYIITRSGNTIYAKFYVPSWPLVIDTTNVLAKTNYGFEYYDSTSSATISSVTLLNDDTVKIVLSGTPTGNDQRLRYAYTGTPASGTPPGAQSTSGVRWNLRDSDPTTPLYTHANANNLYNWSVQFDKPISDDTTAPTITNISSSVGSTSSTITWFTNEMADTKMEYGIDTSYGTQSTLDWSLAPSHSVVLTGLSPNTTYHYRVISKDLANNTTTSSDQTFTTSSTGSAPSQITDAVATAGDTTASVAFTAPSDGGSAITSYTVTSSPGNLTSTGSASPITITGLTNGTPYTFTVTATNAIGTSTPSPASNSVTPTAPDTTTPTITNISSDKTNGSYTVGEVIDIDVTFSEVVSSTGNVTITLETGSVDRTCTFTVTSGTTGTCNYTVQSGDISSDLTVSSVSGTIADAASNAMANFTPTTNLADNKAIVIDAVVPTNQDTVFTASTTKQWGTSVTVVSAAESGGAIWFAPSGTTVFSAGSTMTTAGGTATALFTPATEGSYRLFVIDAVGNISAQSIAVLTVDNTSPTITNISSDKTNGSYTVGEVIDIDVTFSEVVSSTGNVTVTLETGSADRTCTFTVTSSTTGTCNYTVQAGDTTSDLTVSSISGTIADAASNVLINFTPTTNLAANKAIVIDTTPTSAPSSFTATVGSPTSTIDLAWTNPLDSDFASVSIRRSTLSYPTTITEGVSVVADITGTTRADIGLTDGLYYYSIFAKDSTGNISASANVVGIVDTTPPVISAGAPSGTLWSGTTSSNLYLTTSETATCKYSTSASTAYSSMTPFSSTTDTAHSTIVSNLTDGTSYTYYTKCQDTLGNTNTADYTISFSIASASSGGGGGYAGGSTITVTQNPGTTVTVVPTPEAPEDDEDDTENEEPTEDSNTDEDNTPYTPNTTVSSVTSAQFTYLSEDPNILVRLQSLYGADVVTEETYKNQCETNAGKPYYRLCELGGVSATFNLFKDSVVCEGFITPQTSEDAYRFEDVAPRKEVVGIAVKMKKIEGKNVSLVTPDSYQNIYTDIGLSGEAAWIQPVAETALRYGITSSARTTFEPDRNVTRAEAYAMVMSSVCMLPETNTTTDTGTTNTDTPKTWQERLFDRASTDGLTSKTWDTFESERPILRQELFLLASKVSDWAERTGGCDPKPEFCFEGGE